MATNSDLYFNKYNSHIIDSLVFSSAWKIYQIANRKVLKEHYKDYRKNNREALKKQMRKWYEANKEIVAERKKWYPKYDYYSKKHENLILEYLSKK